MRKLLHDLLNTLAVIGSLIKRVESLESGMSALMIRLNKLDNEKGFNSTKN